MRRTLTELMHIATGIVGAAIIASLAAWSVPGAWRAIWDVAYIGMALIVVTGLRPLRIAWMRDRRETADRRRGVDA